MHPEVDYRKARAEGESDSLDGRRTVKENLSASMPHKIRPPALKMAANVPSHASALSSDTKLRPNAMYRDDTSMVTCWLHRYMYHIVITSRVLIICRGPMLFSHESLALQLGALGCLCPVDSLL